ncbi:MAG: hypothetical protein IJR28_00735 [Ottowia sp.]|nr:hypothetical protein [Ottowia sp.]
MNTALTHPPRKHLRTACAALLATLLAAGAAQAALPTSITLTGTQPFPSDPNLCENYEVMATLHGMSTSDPTQNAVCATITVKQGGQEHTLLTDCSGGSYLAPGGVLSQQVNLDFLASVNPLWALPDPTKEFEMFVEVTADPPGARGIRSPTIRGTCDTDATVVPGTGGAYSTCTGGKEDDGSDNCVCPAGTEENSSGECVTPSGGGDAPKPPFFANIDNSSPTMSELGLLLSGLALAGAAAPALRRREKQGKKADTHR